MSLGILCFEIFLWWRVKGEGGEGEGEGERVKVKVRERASEL